MTHLWYAAYGSNLDAARLRRYLDGGRPPGALRSLPGARDATPPSGDRALRLPGTVYFAWESPTWGGGVAFLDPDAAGTCWARAYRLTVGQFSDVAAQEMHRAPSGDLDLTDLLREHRWRMGPGRYESLHVVGAVDDEPVVTFTAPDRLHDLAPAGLNPPAAAYLATIARGLVDGLALSPDDAVAYLLDLPGVAPAWTPDAVLALLA